MASLLTGRLPHEHRVVRDPQAAQRFGQLAPGTTTIAERLGAAGYACGAVVNNVYRSPLFGLDQGFGKDWDYRGSTQETIRSAEETVDAALGWIDRQHAPFFLLVHFMEPPLLYDPPAEVRETFTGHDPAPVPVPFGRRDALAAPRAGQRPSDEELAYVERLYDEEILYVDGAIGRLLATLRERPRWSETVVVITSDHGEEFFDHGSFEHGHSLYAELTRVPLVVAGPGLARGQVTDVAQHIDVARGILALAGLAPESAEPNLFSTLRAGQPLGEGIAIAEGVLYGPPRAA